MTWPAKPPKQLLAPEAANASAGLAAHAEKSARALKRGSLVAFPTETVYGLGADATNPTAVARLYAVKGRPLDHPVIVHIADASALNTWARETPAYAYALAKQFWPGPMTLVLRRTEIAKDFVTGGQDTVGLRVPNHPVALELLARFTELGGQGVAAPSANRFGSVSPTTAAAVRDELQNLLSPEDLILEGGPSQVGVESTIIDCTSERPKILRPGAITQAMVEEATGLTVNNVGEKPRVSGSLASHYAPKALVVLDERPQAGDGFIALAEVPTPDGVTRLASPRTNAEFAQELYSALRAADAQSLPRVVIYQPSGDDIAVAIRDRLKRAANG